MIGVVAVDLGLVVALLGLIAVLKPLPRLGLPTRRRAAALLALGLLGVALGILLPVAEQRAAPPVTRLDELLPVWQFDERHSIRVQAPPERVEAAIRAVTAREIRFFRLLTWLRNPRRSFADVPESILAPPPDDPILDVALRSGFLLLAEEPGRELVIGTVVIAPDGRSGALERTAGFRTLVAPGYAKAAMNFRWLDAGGGRTDLTTETRVFATDPGSRRRFAAYWRFIYPGSSLIRHEWLRAIRRRAESSGERRVAR